MKSSKKFTRRRFLATTAAASAVTLAPPFIRTSCAAGKLKVALWDHWVPGANKAMETLCHDWAAKNRVDISIDFITSHGNKLELTVAAEKLAKSGHDLVQAMGWYAGLDVTKMYAPPGGRSDKKLQAEWAWEKFVQIAEKCAARGHPFGLGLSQTTDCVDFAGALFHAFGAEMVNAKGDVTVNSDNTRHVLEYSRRLCKVLPKDVIAWAEKQLQAYAVM